MYNPVLISHSEHNLTRLTAKGIDDYRGTRFNDMPYKEPSLAANSDYLVDCPRLKAPTALIEQTLQNLIVLPLLNLFFP
jgi:hypothetical protein